MKIEVDEIMTELPQTPPVQEAIEALKPFALLAEVAHKDHRDSRPVIFAFDTAVAQRLTVGDLRRAAHAVETLQRCSDETARETVGYQVPDGMKLVYVKRWRTIVPLPVAYVDEIVEALRPLSSDETAHNVRDATIKEIARYLDEEGHGIPAEKVRFMGPAVTRPHREAP